MRDVLATVQHESRYSYQTDKEWRGFLGKVVLELAPRQIQFEYNHVRQCLFDGYSIGQNYYEAVGHN